ncbi:MAG: FGGY family carbohydrate kinase, partial [Pseudomonadota bacterium]
MGGESDSMASLIQPISKLLSSVTRRAESSYAIGVDVGTTSVKTGLIDGEGELLASYSETYEKTFPRESWVEQDPFDWTRLIEEAFSSFDKTVRLEKVRTLCICSQVNTHVFVDKDGRPLMPAIV